MKNKMLNKIMVELILLATIVGYIPELSVSGFADMFGPCGFDNKTCYEIQIQGLIKLVLAFVCMLASVVIGFYITFLNGSEGDDQDE